MLPITVRAIRPFHIWIILCLISVGGFFFDETRLPALILFALLQPVMAIGVMKPNLSFFGPVLYKCEKANVIALTFDDGPDPKITPDILDLLDKKGIKATFFVIAQKAEKDPEIVKRIFDAGHVVSCHDLHHSVFSNFRMTRMMSRDISRSREIIRSIIGRNVAIYRPPVGLTNPHLFPVLDKLGMTCVCWNKSGGDAGNRSRKGIERIGSLDVSGGDIVLLHDALPDESMKSLVITNLEKLFTNIADKNLVCETVDKALGIQAYAD